MDCHISVRGRHRPACLAAAAALAFGVAAAFADDPPGDAPLADPLAAFQSQLADMIEQVAPSVVVIQAEREVVSSSSEAAGPPSRSRTAVQTGTGVVIRSDGMILTSEHVVHGARRIVVTLADRRTFEGRVVGMDARSDLAVLRIPGDRLQPAKLGDVREVRRGHFAIALGNPMGLAADGQTAVTHGIISAIGRALPETFGQEEDRYYGDLIQTTTPLNPGNSGGPLLDIHGRVIGIVTAIMTRSGTSEGVGFAIPMGSRTRAVIDKLLRGEEVSYGFLGIDMRAVRPDEVHGGMPPGGVVVQDVIPRGPADLAGLQVGDVITSFRSEPISSPDHLLRLIGNTPPGDAIDIELVRGGRRRVVPAVVGRRTPDGIGNGHRDAALVWRGAALDVLSEPLRRQAGVRDAALCVIGIEPDTPAAAAELQPGDIIVAIEGKPLSTPEQGLMLLNQLGGPVTVQLTNGSLHTVEAP